jgi:hypothetical protein
MLISNRSELLVLLLNEKPKTFEFVFPNMSVEQNRAWYLRVRKDYNPCGCVLSTWFAVFSVFFSLSYFLIVCFLKNEAVGFVSIAAAIGLVVASVAAGKQLGIAIGNRRFRSSIRELGQLVEE